MFTAAVLAATTLGAVAAPTSDIHERRFLVWFHFLSVDDHHHCPATPRAEPIPAVQLVPADASVNAAHETSFVDIPLPRVEQEDAADVMLFKRLRPTNQCVIM